MDPVLNNRSSAVADTQTEVVTKNLVREAVNRLGRSWEHARTTIHSADLVGCLEPDLPSVQVHEDCMKPAKRRKGVAVLKGGDVRDKWRISNGNCLAEPRVASARDIDRGRDGADKRLTAT